jgi:hypothetical protein
LRTLDDQVGEGDADAAGLGDADCSPPPDDAEGAALDVPATYTKVMPWLVIFSVWPCTHEYDWVSLVATDGVPCGVPSAPMTCVCNVELESGVKVSWPLFVVTVPLPVPLYFTVTVWPFAVAVTSWTFVASIVMWPLASTFTTSPPPPPVAVTVTPLLVALPETPVDVQVPTRHESSDGVGDGVGVDVVVEPPHAASTATATAAGAQMRDRCMTAG